MWRALLSPLNLVARGSLPAAPWLCSRPAAPAMVEDTRIAGVIWEYKLGCRAKEHSSVMTVFHNGKVVNFIVGR